MAFALILKWFCHAERETGWAEGMQMATKGRRQDLWEKSWRNARGPWRALSTMLRSRDLIR